MNDFDVDGIFLQCAFAIGQGAGARRRVRAGALSDLRARFGPGIEALGEKGWNELGSDVLGKMRLIGEVAAAKALAERRDLLDSADLIEAAHEVALSTLEIEASSTSLCVSVQEIGLPEA